MKKWKIVWWILLLLLVGIQFFRPERNVAAVAGPHDIQTAYAMSPELQGVFKRACNDCHTNNTEYPWYANIQPVAWWLNNHVKDGKRHLNLSEFMHYSLAKQYHKVEEIAHEVNDGGMPLSSYTLVHTNAKLTAEEKKMISDWCEAVRDTMKAKYPADSLIRKKPAPKK